MVYSSYISHILSHKGTYIMAYNISRNARIQLPAIPGTTTQEEIFSLQDLIDERHSSTCENHWLKLLTHLVHFFKEQECYAKPNESIDQFLTRLFYKAYYKKGFAYKDNTIMANS